MDPRTLALRIIFVNLLVSSPGWGWGELGHQTIAEIAERNLSTQAKNFIVDILGVEPLATASIFPDIVRPDKRFDRFAPYHYIDIPPNIPLTELGAEKRKTKDAHVILTQAPEFLKNPKKADLQKKILLRYLIHVVGDVHQPLHVGNGFDSLGNLCEVKWREVRSGIVSGASLHSVWDDRIFDYVKNDFYKAHPERSRARYGITYPEYADLLIAWEQKLPDDKRQELKSSIHTNFMKWYEEALALHPKVYPDAAKTMTPVTRTYCRIEDPKTKQQVSLNFDETSIPVLQEDYARRALDVAQFQILKAGYRLAFLLNELSAKIKVTSKGANAHKALMNSVELLNEKGQP